MSSIGKPAVLRTSRYTFELPTTNGAVLFNARTGAIVQLEGADAPMVVQALAVGRGSPEIILQLDPETVSGLWEAGFIVPDEEAELAEIRKTYWHARREAPIVLTVTTTLDCNLLLRGPLGSVAWRVGGRAPR